MTTNYRRGADFERAVWRDLTGRGAFCVRAAGSHGLVDIVALWPAGPAWLIQAKRNGRMSGADSRELGRVARTYSAVPVKASKVERGKITYERFHPFGAAGYQWSELTI